jgi:hypothetical protein
MKYLCEKLIPRPMKKSIYVLFSAVAILSCAKSTTNSETASSDSSVVSDAEEMSSLYAQVDSVFQINGKSFRANVKQYDLTELVSAQGDTLSRPTYACVVSIFDEKQRELFRDSLSRESWGYEGKIAPIDAYTLAFPRISSQGNEIIFAFLLSEETDGDAMEGGVAFEVIAKKSRYSLQVPAVIE